MVMICKHCFDDTTGPINQDCEYCKKGLKKDDVFLCSDLLVPIITKLNQELGITTYYAEEGYFNKKGQSESYIVFEDTEAGNYVFEEIGVLIGTTGIINRDGRGKKRITFTIKPCEDVYEFNQIKANLFKMVHKRLSVITSRYEWEEIQKRKES